MDDFILAGDIGGTKTCLGIFAKGKTSRPLLRYKASYSSRKSEGLEEIIGDFLGRHQVSIGAVCLGV
ncbi:MAG: glucokinase, partial [Deltaproteobacteria bacterium]|nr:glucokinase [Deltaproteobacteria bacterium]